LWRHDQTDVDQILEHRAVSIARPRPARAVNRDGPLLRQLFCVALRFFFRKIAAEEQRNKGTFLVTFKAKFHYAIWFEAGSKLVA